MTTEYTTSISLLHRKEEKKEKAQQLPVWLVMAQKLLGKNGAKEGPPRLWQGGGFRILTQDATKGAQAGREAKASTP